MITTLFLDFDGVILDSVEAKTEAFYSMYLPYGEEFARRVRDFHCANGGVSRFEKFRIWHEEWLRESLSEQRMAELSTTFSTLSLQKVIESPFVPGALEFLQMAHDRHKMYVITGSAQEDIDHTVRQLDLEKYFVQVCGSPRTKIDWGQQLLREHQVSPKEVVFVGDAESDRKAAEALGIHFILRATELNSDWSHACTHVIRDLTELNERINIIDQDL